jgi:homoserine dehydrogenase
MATVVKIAIAGFGTVAKSFLTLLDSEKDRLWKDYQLAFILVAASDSKGSVICEQGLPINKLMIIKWDTGSVAHYPNFGFKNMTALEMIETTTADLIIEASPANLEDGQPALIHIIRALELGKHVVSANKAPLVLAWAELKALAQQKTKRLRFGAAAGAGLPVLELGAFLGQNGEILEFSGVLNATSQYVLNQMEQGNSYDSAILKAQAAGFAETNPSIDVGGWDTAMKTLILANSFLNTSLCLTDVIPVGITGLTQTEILQAVAEKHTWRLVGRVFWEDEGWKVTVSPQRIPIDHPLALGGWRDKVLWIKTRNYGDQIHISKGGSGKGTAATILTDVLDIVRQSG